MSRFLILAQALLVAGLLESQSVSGYPVVTKETNLEDVINVGVVSQDETDASLVGQRRQLADLSEVLQNVGLYFKGRKNKGGNSEGPNADQTRSRYHEGQILDVNLTPPGGIRPKRTYSYYHEDKSVPVLPQVVSSPGEPERQYFKDYQDQSTQFVAAVRPKREHNFHNFQNQHIGGHFQPHAQVPHHVVHSVPHHAPAAPHQDGLHGREGIRGFFESKIHGGFGDSSQFNGFDVGGARFRSELPDLSHHFPQQFPVV